MQTNREVLLKIVALVQPALSNQNYIPALSHILFSADRGRVAVAYNDVAAILVACPDLADLELCIPGELLAKSLSSLSGENVKLDADSKTGNLLLSCGRSKLKLPTLPEKDFPLSLPTGKADKIDVTDDMLNGLRMCLQAVGNDPTHPEQMGVTLDTVDGKAVLYSTDNVTISAYYTTSKLTLPGDSPLILPTFFCEQLLRLAKAFDREDIELRLRGHAVLATFGEQATLMSKVLVDVDAMDYPTVIAKYVDRQDVEDGAFQVPVSMDSAFSRALLVLANEADKATKVEADADGLLLVSTSTTGEAEDTVVLDDDQQVPKKQRMEFHVDPSLVVRGLKSAECVFLAKRALVLATDDGSYLHLIAHCAA